jgi:hypothetical protein
MLVHAGGSGRRQISRGASDFSGSTHSAKRHGGDLCAIRAELRTPGQHALRRNFFWTSCFTKRKVASSQKNSVVKRQPNTCRRHSHVMRVSEIIIVSTAAVGSAYLYIRLWRKARTPPPKTHWTGHGIDITPMSERVQRARGDFAAELQSRPHDTCQRRGLLVRARRAVAQLAYFRRRNAQSSNHTEDDTRTHVF